MLSTVFLCLCIVWGAAKGQDCSDDLVLVSSRCASTRTHPQSPVHHIPLCALTSTPGSPPPFVDTARATAFAAATSSVYSGTLKLVTQGTAPTVTTPAAALATHGPASGGAWVNCNCLMVPDHQLSLSPSVGLLLVLLVLAPTEAVLVGLKYPATHQSTATATASAAGRRSVSSHSTIGQPAVYCKRHPTQPPLKLIIIHPSSQHS